MLLILTQTLHLDKNLNFLNFCIDRKIKNIL